MRRATTRFSTDSPHVVEKARARSGAEDTKHATCEGLMEQKKRGAIAECTYQEREEARRG